MRALAQPHRPRGRPAVRAFLRPSRPFAFAAPQGLRSPKTRIHVRLLGPCSKTGRTNPFHQRHDGARTEAADLDPAKPLADFSDERPSRARAIPDSPAAPSRAAPLSSGKEPPQTDRSSVRFRPRRERRRQKTSTPARSAGPIPRWHAIGRDASPVDWSPPVLARYDSDRGDDWKPTFEGNSRPQSIDSYASPNNDFKFF